VNIQDAQCNNEDEAILLCHQLFIPTLLFHFITVLIYVSLFGLTMSIQCTAETCSLLHTDKVVLRLSFASFLFSLHFMLAGMCSSYGQ